MADLKTQLEIGVDASGVETGVGKVKKSLADLGNAAETAGEKASAGLGKAGTGSDAAAKRIEAQTKNLIGSIQRQIAQIEAGGAKGGAKFFETLATQRGVPVDALKPFLQQLDEANAKQAQLAKNGLGQHFDYATRSVKQTTAALRQVPSQLTDIIVSLQGGQAPLTVLLQQGGQLKDIFGGIGPAARALGGYLLALVNPFTLAAAAAAALAYAYKSGTDEIDAYAKALILSGNAAGTTVSKLNAQAAAISKVAGTQAAAADALAQFAADGNVASASLERFALVAVQMERTAGQAVSKTVEQFAALGKEPLQASIKLNETTRFLTVSLYQQIKALEDQGRVADAAAAAQNGFASAMESRTAALESRLGSIERAWKGVKDAAAGAWSAMLNVGRGDPGTKLDQARSDLEALQEIDRASRARGGTPTAQFQARLEQQRQIVSALDETIRLENRSAAAQSDSVKQTKARIDFDAIAKKNLVDKGELLKKEIELIKNSGKAAGASQKEIDAAIAGARERFKPAQGPRDQQRGIDKSDLSFDLSQIKSEADRLVGIYSDAERVLETLRAGSLVKDKEYYESKRQFLALESEAKEDAFRKEIARLEQEQVAIRSRRAKDSTDRAQIEKDVIDNERAVAKAKADLAILQAHTSSRNTVLNLEEANALDQLAKSYASARLAAQDFLDTQNRQQSRLIEGLGKGAQERGRTAGVNQIDDNFAGQRRELENLKILGKMTEEEYQTRLGIINEFQRKSLASFEAYYDKLIELQGNSALGASEAVNNYIDSARNVAASTEQFVSNTLNGLEDSLTKFLTTGKGGFKEFANAIVADITRIIVKQQIANALAAVMGSGSNGGTGWEHGGTGGSGFGFVGDIFKALMGGGRAIGGPVSRGSIYEVNENGGPGELLNVGGRQYLMASQSGNVTPQSQSSNRQAMTVIQNFMLSAPADRRTQQQVAAAAGRGVQTALARNT